MGCKTKTNTLLMYEVPDKDTIKSEILPHLPMAKSGYTLKTNEPTNSSKRGDGVKTQSVH